MILLLLPHEANAEMIAIQWCMRACVWGCVCVCVWVCVCLCVFGAGAGVGVVVEVGGQG